MVYRGFTWNATAGDLEGISDLLERIIDEKPMLKIDRRMAAFYLAKITLVMEVSPDGSSPSHGCADA